ncbi:hypothetical protein KDAU_74610 [Dictyobacter aurantiacus]|uniref:ORC1/DEAH AAA+ ATPase domain-containing protein n=1 Tax=Dictyobacter aurantiacus TaxID=1936993 RepID=A0A401ZLP8_9CHLR|nr:hypothetical protein KDAU_00100 [Dictyobacter aurantiacus]GCE07766.1 hypothetical protein KDAU_50950 [Dictyobacter aurantiacus]GCE07785.1 hypothetical protein KDAU_51140 [Dictyobacter aurantiacus]GCE10132.1 hypothetical protein KDAU_74610 [Dictyobacter aurantiacus]
MEIPFSTFEQTREYRRFVQVCEAARRYRYLVVCVGDRGVGKTWAAREYAQWAAFERLLMAQGVAFPAECPMPRTAYYRPKATSTPKSIEQDLALLLWGLQMIADHASAVAQESGPMSGMIRPDGVGVVMVDEVDGLSQAGLEVLRDVFDRSRVGMVLLGRSGSAERLQKMAALSSRVGVLHAFGALGKPETCVLLEQQIQQMGLSLSEGAAEAFVQKTEGNFQEMYLVLCHLDYLLLRHGTYVVTAEVIEEAGDRLLTQKNVQRLRKKR